MPLIVAGGEGRCPVTLAGLFRAPPVHDVHRIGVMEPNHYEASEHPSETAGGVQHKRKFSRGYILLEVFWISLAIAMTGYIAFFYLLLPFVNDHVLTAVESSVYTVALVLFFLAFYGDLFVLPTAIEGLFGRMGMVVGAACGLVLFVVGAAWWLSTPFVPNS